MGMGRRGWGRGRKERRRRKRISHRGVPGLAMWNFLQVSAYRSPSWCHTSLQEDWSRVNSCRTYNTAFELFPLILGPTAYYPHLPCSVHIYGGITLFLLGFYVLL
jgi:hypothetical protein